MEEGLRAAMLRVRWRLVMGVIGLVVTVLLTLPVAMSQLNLGTRMSEIWPNSPDWPGVMTSEIWPNQPAYEIWPDQPTDEIWPTSA
jgi:hypothetical protein